jgi:ribosomal protein L40E
MNKFCPKCGATNSAKRTHCRKCGYPHLHTKRKKSNFKMILLIILLLILGWIAFRLFTNQQIIPEEIISTLKNLLNK